MDDRLRALGRAARAEVEAGLDVDHELAALHDHRPAEVVAGGPRPVRSTSRSHVWFAAAAAAAVVLVGGVWLLVGDDDSIRTAEPTPSVDTTDAVVAPATTVPPAPETTTPPSTTAAPSTSTATSIATTTVPGTTVPTTVVPTAEVPVVDWRDLPWEASGIRGSCVRASPTCTQLVHAADGTPVTYDPTTRVLTRHGRPAMSVTLPDSYGDAGFLVHAGPSGVVYLQVDPAVPAEQAADVVAVTLLDGDAGREVGRWADVANRVGDSELVPTAAGLVNVNCCGPDAVRPDPGAEVLVPWLSPTGDQVTSDAPTIRVEISFPSLTVHRTDPISGGTRSWTYQPGGDWMPRGMPRVVPTFDGGFIAAEYGGAGTTIARGFVDGTVEQRVLDDPVLFADSLDPAGRFLLGDGTALEGWFVRVDPLGDYLDRWDVRADIDTLGGTGTIDLVDIDATIDARPTWATDPVAFADAVRGPVAVNEVRTITAERRSEVEWRVTVTTSNLFDDSVFADRWLLVLNRGDDGRFRFVSGQWSQACQPDRGHQDFSPELCV